MRQQDVKTNAEYIKRMMKRFKLVDMREQYQDLILEAESSSMDYETFLVRLPAAEEEGKIRRRTEKLRREAGFESETRLEDIDYGFNQSLDQDKIMELGRLDFLDAGENVILTGPPGVGKSMIATGTGMRAVSAGYKVLFVNAKDLADRLNNDVIAGAGIDVFDVEPPLSDDEPLLHAKNTLLTPHVAFASEESMSLRAEIVFDNLASWMDGNQKNVIL